MILYLKRQYRYVGIVMLQILKDRILKTISSDFLTSTIGQSHEYPKWGTEYPCNSSPDCMLYFKQVHCTKKPRYRTVLREVLFKLLPRCHRPTYHLTSHRTTPRRAAAACPRPAQWRQKWTANSRWATSTARDFSFGPAGGSCFTIGRRTCLICTTPSARSTCGVEASVRRCAARRSNI